MYDTLFATSSAKKTLDPVPIPIERSACKNVGIYYLASQGSDPSHFTTLAELAPRSHHTRHLPSGAIISLLQSLSAHSPSAHSKKKVRIATDLSRLGPPEGLRRDLWAIPANALQIGQER